MFRDPRSFGTEGRVGVGEYARSGKCKDVFGEQRQVECGNLCGKRGEEVGRRIGDVRRSESRGEDTRDLRRVVRVSTSLRQVFGESWTVVSFL